MRPPLRTSARLWRRSPSCRKATASGALRAASSSNAVPAAVVLVFLAGSLPAAMAQHHSHGVGQPAAVLDEIVVTGERIDDYMREHPQQVVIMTRGQIEAGHYLDLGDALDAMAGVDVQPSGSGPGSRITIRGSGGNARILVLINGRPAGAGQYGSADLDSIPVGMVQRIEVFKPPAPVWLGPNASAGAVNITLSGLAALAAGAEKAQPGAWRLQAYGGAFGQAGTRLAHRGAHAGRSLSLDAGVDRCDGRRPNNDRTSGRVGVQWEGDPDRATRWDLGGRFFRSRHGSPGRTDNPTPQARQQVDRGDIEARLRGLVGGTGDFDIKLFGDFVRLEDHSQSGLTAELESAAGGIKGEGQWSAEDGGWGLRLGSQLLAETAEHTLSGDHSREQLSVHGQYDHELRPFTATLGARLDCSSDFDAHPAGHIGLARPLGERGLVKLNGGYQVNIPTFGQLYQPSHGSIDQVRGNPGLVAEKVTHATLGVQYRLADDRVLEVTAFREDTRHKIAYQDYPDLIKRPVNLERVCRQGIEAALKWALATTLTGDVSYTWQQTRNRANGRQLTYAPAHRFKLTGRYAHTSTGARFEATLNGASRQYSDLANTDAKSVDGYLSVDARIAWGVDWFKAAAAEMFLQIDNLFDRHFEVHYGYPDDGVRATVGLAVSF